MRRVLRIAFSLLLLVGIFTPLTRVQALTAAQQRARCQANDMDYDSTLKTCVAKAPQVAVGPCYQANSRFSKICLASGEKVPIFIRNALIGFLIIAALLALIFLIWGGFKWITSGGDKAQIDSARKMIIAAIIGLILAFLSFFIISVVLGLFGLSLQDLKLPTLPRS